MAKHFGHFAVAEQGTGGNGSAPCLTFSLRLCILALVRQFPFELFHDLNPSHENFGWFPRFSDDPSGERGFNCESFIIVFRHNNSLQQTWSTMLWYYVSPPIIYDPAMSSKFIHFISPQVFPTS